MVASLSLWATHAQAQLRLGVKGGYNYTNWKFGQLKVKTEDKNGFFIGPSLKANLPSSKSGIGLGVNVSALYDQQKVAVGDENTVEITKKSVAFPVNLQIDVLRGSSVEFFVCAGPQFDFNLDNDETIIDASHTWKFKESGFSLNAGAGILLLHFLQLSVNYNMVCGSTAEVTMNSVMDDAKTFKSRANSGSVALAIYF